MTELPPAHVDTPQQKLALRRNRAATFVRSRFPRGTRVEASNDMGLTGNGHYGTVSAHIAGGNALGGHLNVLWDGRTEASRMLATSVRVVGRVQRVAARDVGPGDIVEGRTVAYNRRAPHGQRVLRFADGGQWIAHHAEKLALVRQVDIQPTESV